MNITNYYFLKIPACESSNVLSILQDSIRTNEKTLRALSYQDFLLNRDSLNLAHMGLMLTSPITRLVNAYQQMHDGEENRPSFEEFYRNPLRVNFYSKLFRNIELDKIGFIALDTHHFKSLLLAENWINVRLGRTRYDSFRGPKKTKISDNDLANIEQLYAEDIALFEEAKIIFESRLQNLIVTHQNIASVDKRIVIHIGPPKTGTSAIQYWFKQHSDELYSQGTYYPEHQIDGNNISSGNVDALITQGKADNPAFYDHLKASKLLKDFNESELDLLVLSSEHFFYYLPWLFAFFPNAQYIFYVRNPLAAIESGFHQEIKRHRRTKPFAMPRRLSFQQLEILARVSQEFSPNLTISYFDSKLFKNGSLINDFVSLLPKNLEITSEDQRVNTQYCLEAIELMRFCNNFASDALLLRLDKFFQEYSQTQSLYSYISKDDVHAFEKDLKQQVMELKKQLPQINTQKMYDVIDNYVPKANVPIEQKKIDLTEMINKMKEIDLPLAVELSRAIKANDVIQNSSLLKLLTLTRQEKILLKAKKIASQIRLIFSQQN